MKEFKNLEYIDVTRLFSGSIAWLKTMPNLKEAHFSGSCNDTLTKALTKKGVIVHYDD